MIREYFRMVNEFRLRNGPRRQLAKELGGRTGIYPPFRTLDQLFLMALPYIAGPTTPNGATSQRQSDA